MCSNLGRNAAPPGATEFLAPGPGSDRMLVSRDRCPSPASRRDLPVRDSPEKLRALLAAAAELRAGGLSWAKVGEKVGRQAETCRQWPRRHPAAWRELFREAEAQVIAEAGAEARGMLRNLLRSKNEKTILAAAQLLMRCREERALREEQTERLASLPARTDAERIAAYLTRLSDAEVNAVVEELLTRHPGAAADAPPRP